MDFDLSAILKIALPLLLIYIGYKILAKRMPAGRFKPKEIEDLPLDMINRIRVDLRKSAKLSKPPQIRYLYLSGDNEIPGRYLGRVKGLLSELNYYTIFYRPRRMIGTKVLFAEREFSSVPALRTLTIYGRGIEVSGPLFHFVVPTSDWQLHLKLKNKTERENLNQLWLMRVSHIQILCEKHCMIDLIEMRDYVVKKAILPKAQVRAFMSGAYAMPHEDERTEELLND